jgi:hypothetical protein
LHYYNLGVSVQVRQHGTAFTPPSFVNLIILVPSVSCVHFYSASFLLPPDILNLLSFLV